MEVKTSEDTRHTLYQQGKLCLSHSMESYLYSPVIMCPPSVLPQHRHPISSCPWKHQQTAVYYQNFLVRFSLWRPDQCSSTTQCKADQYKCVFSKESFITHRILSHACFTEHPLSCVCFSEMFLQESALAFHTCIHFKETLLHVFAPAQHHPTDFPKNP